MHICESCRRNLTEDATFCDGCGTCQANRQALPYAPFYAPIDIAQSVMRLLAALWNSLSDDEKAAILSAVSTYVLARSPEAARTLSEWFKRNKDRAYIS